MKQCYQGKLFLSFNDDQFDMNSSCSGWSCNFNENHNRKMINYQPLCYYYHQKSSVWSKNNKNQCRHLFFLVLWSLLQDYSTPTQFSWYSHSPSNSLWMIFNNKVAFQNGVEDFFKSESLKFFSHGIRKAVNILSINSYLLFIYHPWEQMCPMIPLCLHQCAMRLLVDPKHDLVVITRN